MKELQCVHFEKPERQHEAKMMMRGDELKPIIPVAFAADDNYVPMLSTTIYSMLKNASRDYRYDVIVLTRDISEGNKKRVEGFLSRFENASIRFCDVSQMVDSYNLPTNNPHISIETYYRFLVQQLLPHYDKVLYLDSDLIVKDDVSKLYTIDLGSNLLGAVRDLDFLGNINMKDGERMRYAKEILRMHDPYAYFQAGVLVMNTKAMRAFCSIERWLEAASDDRFIYNDQDVLNACCEGRVAYIDYSWNVMTDCANRIRNFFAYAPADVYDAYLKSRNCEKIVHYAGFQKPWKMVDCDRFDLYWEYARETPFYEEMLSMLLATEEVKPCPIDDHESAVAPDSPLRQIFDPIAPMGTARREVLKSVGRAVKGLK